MTQPFADPTFDDDLHLLMTLAVLSGQHGLSSDIRPVYEAWAKAYPQDALGDVGIGLSLVGEGKFEEGYELVRKASETSQTRVEQALDVMRSLEESAREAGRPVAG